MVRTFPLPIGMFFMRTTLGATAGFGEIAQGDTIHLCTCHSPVFVYVNLRHAIAHRIGGEKEGEHYFQEMSSVVATNLLGYWHCDSTNHA